MMIYRC